MTSADGMIVVNGANGKLGRTVMARLSPERARAGVRRHASRYVDPLIIGSDGRVAPAALVGVSAIINCAGVVQADQNSLTQANVEHAVELARCARAAGVRHFVQVSSFTIYGTAETINATAPDQPITAYGRSKLQAERALAALATPHFKPINVRLPFMFDREQPALIGRTISMLTKLPFLPAPPEPVRRSMMTYGDAADTLISIAQSTSTEGMVAVADPTYFSFGGLLESMRRHQLPTPAVVAIPRSLGSAVARVAPTLARRLLQSSMLVPEANWAALQTMRLGIAAEIEAIVAAVTCSRG